MLRAGPAAGWRGLAVAAGGGRGGARLGRGVGSQLRPSGSAHRSDWIPLTSLGASATRWGSSSPSHGLSAAGAVLVVAGALVLWGVDRVLATCARGCSLAPLVVSALVGLRFHFLLSRTLATSAWAVPVAVAALIEQARRHGALMGVLVAVLVGVVMMRSIPIATTTTAGPGRLRAGRPREPRRHGGGLPVVVAVASALRMGCGRPDQIRSSPRRSRRWRPAPSCTCDPVRPSAAPWGAGLDGPRRAGRPPRRCPAPLRLGTGYTLACYRLTCGSAGSRTRVPQAGLSSPWVA